MTQPTLNPQARYSGVAILLHWLVAILVIANLVIVWTADYAPDAIGAVMIHTHKSFGITVLGLAILRLLWRAGHPPPPLVGVSPLERWSAHAAHALLYGLIFALPLSGWMEDSAWEGAAKNPTMLYGLVEWTHIPAIFNMDPAPKERLHGSFELAHTVFGYALYVLLTLHLAGALKHQFIDRMPSLQRMWPGR
jgi:cytochrome b561